MSTEDSCNLCLEDIEAEDYICPCDSKCVRLHSECMSKYVSKCGYKCMVCKKRIKRFKFYFAGKMAVYDEDRLPLITRDGNNCMFCIEDTKVTKDSVDTLNNVDGRSETATPFHCIEKTNLLQISDYINLERRIPLTGKKKYIITGPILHLYKGDWEESQHGYFNISNEFTEEEVKLLNVRNDEMIDSCDVFSLYLNECALESMSEFGSAREKRKILVLCDNYYQHISSDDIIDEKIQKEYKCFIQKSIDSFQKLSYTDRNLIIFTHPNMRIKTYNAYLKYLGR
jgi:hypothetical protein